MIQYLNKEQVYELNDRHGYFEYADAQGDVSRAFANDSVAAYLRVNEEAQAIMAEHSLSPRELLEQNLALRNALFHLNELRVYGALSPDADIWRDVEAALAKHKEV